MEALASVPTSFRIDPEIYAKLKAKSLAERKSIARLANEAFAALVGLTSTTPQEQCDSGSPSKSKSIKRAKRRRKS
jgi:hypothetical protein